MAIRLEKGQRINLEKSGGKKLERFCVGCNWGAISKPKSGLMGLLGKKDVIDVDLDLSCALLNKNGEIIDYIYSPEYREDFLKAHKRDPGKLVTRDGALHHSGDDRKGDSAGDDGQDNEVITVDLGKVNADIENIIFFLNNAGKEDFSQIPYAAIRMYEGTPQKQGEVFASYDVAALPQYAGKRAMIMGKLYRKNGEWKFAAIGDATEDKHLCDTLDRICKDYSR